MLSVPVRELCEHDSRDRSLVLRPTKPLLDAPRPDAGEAAVAKLWRRFCSLDVRVDATSVVLHGSDGGSVVLEAGAVIGDGRETVEPVDTNQVVVLVLLSLSIALTIVQIVLTDEFDHGESGAALNSRSRVPDATAARSLAAEQYHHCVTVALWRTASGGDAWNNKSDFSFAAQN